MSFNLSVNGVVYPLPTLKERNWEAQVNSFFTAIAMHTLQKVGGNFPLTADIDYGSSFGHILAYIKSKSLNLPANGFIRLNASDLIATRNAGNTLNTYESVNASGRKTVTVPQGFSAVASTDVFTSTGQVPSVGDVVQFGSFTGTGINLANLYYVFNVVGQTFQCYTTAGGPVVLDVTADGSGLFFVLDPVTTQYSNDILFNKSMSFLRIESESGTIAASAIAPTKGQFRVTGGDTSFHTISNPVSGQILFLYNDSGVDITVLNTGGNILTGTGLDTIIKNGAAVTFAYNSDDAKWLMAGGSGGGGLAPKPISTTTAGVAGSHYLTDTSAGAFTLTLPTGAAGSVVMVSDANETWDLNNLTIAPATGQKISGYATNETLVCDVKRGWVELSWNTALSSWSMRSLNTLLSNAQAGTYKAVTGAYSINLTDYFISASGASNYAVSLPSAVSAGAGRIFVIKSRMNSGVLLNVATYNNQTIDGVDPASVALTLAQNESMNLMSNGANWEVF